MRDIYEKDVADFSEDVKEFLRQLNGIEGKGVIQVSGYLPIEVEVEDDDIKFTVRKRIFYNSGEALLYAWLER